MMQRIAIASFFLLLQGAALAQSETVEMAETMRSNGKIYVVLAVVLTIFAGIILYLIRLDRKLSKLEKTIHS